MALTFPYPLDFLSDYVRKETVSLSIQRNDEMSGSGDGRYWTAQLSRPLWTASMSLKKASRFLAREIDAKIIALNGSANTLLWADPSYEPMFGTTVELAMSSIVVSGIKSDRTAISFSGLPPGFMICTGDRFSVNYSGRYYYASFSEDAQANASGSTSQVSVFPYVPMGMSAGASCEFIRPVMKCFIPPSGYTEYTMEYGDYAQGASLTLLQKV